MWLTHRYLIGTEATRATETGRAFAARAGPPKRPVIPAGRLRHRVVEKEPDQKGFVVLERRWQVERTLGRFSHWGGLLRERARRLAFVACLMAFNALNNPE